MNHPGDLHLALKKIDLNTDTGRADFVGKINQWAKDDLDNKQERAAAWAQSVHFLVGDQWIRYDQHTHRWETIPITDANKNIDRPVTNHILRWVTVNASSFTSKPNISVEPNSDEPEDKTAAKVGAAVHDLLWEKLEKDDHYYELALWALTCGNCYRKGYKKSIPKVIDLGGGMQQNLKQVACEAISPFEMVFDGYPKRWSELHSIMQMSVKSLTWIKDNFVKDGPGYTGEAENVQEESDLDYTLSLAEGLRKIVEGQNILSSRATQSSAGQIKDAAVVKYAYLEPCREYPKGFLGIIAKDKLLYYGPSDTFFLDGDIWHPYTSWGYWKQPGSLHSISLVQQLIPMQRRINSIDALLAYNRKTVAVGHWLIPKGAGIPSGTLIGVPGQETEYNPDPVTGAKPELVPGIPLPAQIIEERMMLIADGDLLANSADLRSGKNPSGVNTLGQLEILTEMAEKSASKQVETWEKFIEKSEQIDILLFQSCYQVPDEKINQKLQALTKDITSYDFKTFVGTKLRDNGTVRVEPGSTIARSRLLRQRILLRLASTGILGDMMADPYNQKKFLEEFGLSQYFTESNVDVKKAERAIEMMKSGEYPPVYEGVDNPDIQIIVLLRYMKDPKFMELDDKIKFLFERRRQEYVNLLAQTPLIADDQVPFQGSGGNKKGSQDMDQLLGAERSEAGF